MLCYNLLPMETAVDRSPAYTHNIEREINKEYGNIKEDMKRS